MTEHKDVIIVGAGMAGIAAAAELVHHGKKVLVLEAQGRLGGRLFSDHKSGSATYELGCSWIHESLDNPLFEMALKAGIEMKYDDGAVPTIDDNGVLDPSREIGQAASEFGAFVAIHGGDEDLTLDRMVEKFVNEHPNLTADQKATLPKLLRFPQLPNGLDWTKISAKAGGAPKGRDLMVLGGYDRIYNLVKGKVTDDMIMLNTEVQSIDSSDEYITKVSTSKGQFTCTNVIMTAPATVLKSGQIEFTPKLPAAIGTALKTIDGAHVGKAYLEFAEPFWLDGDKFLYAGEYPMLVSNWYKYNGQSKHPGLVVLTPPPLTSKLENAQTPQAAFEIVKPALEAVREDHSKPVPQPTKVTTTEWTRNKYAQGSYSTFAIGQDREAAVMAFVNGAGRVRFAGEHTIMQGATFVHGAYRSGKREAAYLLSR